MTCTDCGYASAACRSQAQAEYAIRRHSCDRERTRQVRARRGVAKRAAVDRAPRPCLHKIAKHEHGTRACAVLDKCKCLPCSKANAEAERRRQRQIAYGRWQPYVDAGPTRAHVESLRAAGMGLKTVAKASGVAHGTLSKLIYGERGLAPSKRVRHETAVRLQAVQVNVGNLADGAKVSSLGTRRRLQALVAIGWSQSKLGTRLGMEPGNFYKLMRCNELVFARTARAVTALYDELWNTPPANEKWRDKIAFNRSVNYAQARDWAPPLAWDEDTIDDPNAPVCVEVEDDEMDEIAIERTILGDRPVHIGKAERAEVARRLTAAGVSAREIGDRLGRSSRGIQRDRAKDRECVA